ncbi:hypothetical protein HID58_091028, partial [Brassica napus]
YDQHGPNIATYFRQRLFKNLQQGRGLFTSDQVLFTDRRLELRLTCFANSEELLGKLLFPPSRNWVVSGLRLVMLEIPKSKTSPPPSRPKPTIETKDDSVGPHGVSSHLSRLLSQIKDQNRRPMTSLWLLTEILPSSRPKPTIETEDDSVGPHGVSSHLSRLLRQIKDRNRRPTTPLWLLTEIHVRVDDSVRVDGVPSVGLSPLANDLFNLEISSQLFTSFSFQFMNACDSS